MITMQGHTRLFGVPDRLRGESGAAALTAWELSNLGGEVSAGLSSWAGRVVQSVTASAAAPAAAALDCVDCDDTGWYGMPDPADPDRLTALYRRHGDGLRILAADGRWVEPVGVTVGPSLEILTDEIAQDLADAVLAGAHLVRRYLMPAAFLPPADLRAPSAHPAVVLAAVAAPAAPEAVDQSPTDDGNTWLSYAVVDPLDTGAVLQVVRLRPGPIMERYDGGGVWVPDPPVLASLTGLSPPPLVELDQTLLGDVLGQVDSGATDEPAATTAAGGNAETLRRYWSTGGKGGAKIRWGTPGSWSRCYRYLRKYMGQRAKGYCANMTHRNEGKWPGDHSRVGGGGPARSRSAIVGPLVLLANAGDTHPRSVGVVPHVFRVGEIVSFVTAQVSASAGAPDVDTPVGYFEVRGIDASTMDAATSASAGGVGVVTQVVKLLALGKRSNLVDPDGAMSQGTSEPSRRLAVSGGVKGSVPEPVAVGRDVVVGGQGGGGGRIGSIASEQEAAVVLLAQATPQPPVNALRIINCASHTAYCSHPRCGALVQDDDGVAPEQSLLAALAAGAWVGTSTTMTTATADRLRDGIYETATGLTAPVVKALVSGGFPDVPPSEWFDNPRLSELTPTVVEESGRVYGHMADWNMPHIGLPGQVRPPRSRSGYRYFNRNSLHAIAADGSRTTVTVGQLTLVGGHAPLSADAGQAVAHYDNTESAVVDVHVGEDQHGIWFAGSLRSSVTPDRLRAFTASSLSGDWRPINGGLELVACCCVNVPGFPIARARVASGAVVAFTGFGAEGVAMVAAARAGNSALAHRLSAVEADLVAIRAAADPVDIIVTLGDRDLVDVVEQTMRRVDDPAPGGAVLPDDDGVEVVVAEDDQPEIIVPLDDDEPTERPVPAAVARARERAVERGLQARARQRAMVHRTTPEVEYAALVQALNDQDDAVAAAGFKLEDWMTPMGADGQVVKTGARIAVSSAADESVAVAKVLDVTRSGIKVKWIAGRAGNSTIKASEIATLVRTSAAPAEPGPVEKPSDGSSDPKASAPSSGATEPVAAAAARPVPAAVARARAALLAAFNPNQLRDNRGRFIEMGVSVNVKGDDGKERRGTVTKLTKGGPQITYDDNGEGGPKVEIVPSGETTDRIQVAPEAKAELPGGGGDKPLPPEAFTNGKVSRVDDGKPSQGTADNKITNISDYSDREISDLQDAADDPEEKKLLQDELDRRQQERSGVSLSDEAPGAAAQRNRDTAARMDAANAREKARRKPQTAAQQRTDVAADTADSYAPGKSVGRMMDATGKTVEMMPSKGDRIAPGTPLDNANLIMRVRMMHGAGSAKHLAAVRDYGGPKPKKVSKTPRNGIGWSGS